MCQNSRLNSQSNIEITALLSHFVPVASWKLQNADFSNNLSSHSISWGYKRVFEEYTQALYQRYPDIRIEGENYLPIPLYR